MKFLIKLFSNNKIILSVGILLLLPTLLFPMFGDIAIFLEAGRVIANGGKIYVDYIDIKPPAFYYLFALIYKVFGYSEIGVRVFSFIWQTITLILLNQVIKVYLKNTYIASISLIIYSISYAVLGYNSSITPETFFALFLLIILLSYRNITIWNSVLIGISSGILISFKYTFGIILPVLIIINYQYFRHNHIRLSIIMSLSSLLVFLISFIPLIDHSIYYGFGDVNSFIKFYSSVPSINNEFIKYVLTQFSYLFTYYYSMTFFIFLIIGYYLALGGKYKNNLMINLIILSSVLLFLTIMLEKKLSVFHYPRLLLPFVIMTSIGLFETFTNTNWKEMKLISRLFIILIIPILIFFSPIPRYFKEVLNAKIYLTNITEFNNKYSIDGDNVVIRNSFINTANYIRIKAKKDDFIKVISIGGNMINYFLPEYKGTSLPQSCFYYGNYEVSNWKKLHNLEIRKANWIIIQNNDNHPIINGHNRTSLESLNQDSENFEYINQNFVKDTTIDPFIIYRRK